MQVISHFLLSNFACLWVGMGESISSMLLHVIKTLVEATGVAGDTLYYKTIK
jgi:hypothetical protein